MPPPRTSTSAGRPGQTRATICSACTRRYYVRAAGRAPAVGRDVAVDGGELVLVRQTRPGASERTLELPSGKLEPGETPRGAAARELAEEWAGSELLPRGRVLLGRACLLDGVRARLRSDRTDLRSAGRDGPRRGRRGRAGPGREGDRESLGRRFPRRTRALAAAPVSSPRTAAPPSATDALRPESAIDASPPVAPNLVRPPEIPGARRVGRNTLEILLFRGLSTPLALGLVVLQSRFLEPSGRGAYVLAVLSVTILSRLLGQLGVAVTNRLREEAAETRPLVHRALALGVLGGAVGVVLVTAFGVYAAEIGAGLAFLAGLALVPNV